MIGTLLLAVALAAPKATPAPTPAFKDADKTKLISALDAKAAHYGDLSRKIWEFSEVGYKETKSVAVHIGELKAAGFEVQEGVGGMPTAFVASWGSGKPIIGIMAEYDALPGLSQFDAPEKKARVEGDPGHGCGHNLLGTASVAAAIQAKDELMARKLRLIGLRPGDRVLHGFALSMMVGGQAVLQLLKNYGACIVPVGAEVGSRRLLEFARLVRPRMLICTPSYAEYVAEKCQETLGIPATDLGLELIV